MRRKGTERRRPGKRLELLVGAMSRVAPDRSAPSCQAQDGFHTHRVHAIGNRLGALPRRIVALASKRHLRHGGVVAEGTELQPVFPENRIGRGSVIASVSTHRMPPCRVPRAAVIAPPMGPATHFTVVLAGSRGERKSARPDNGNAARCGSPGTVPDVGAGRRCQTLEVVPCRRPAVGETQGKKLLDREMPPWKPAAADKIKDIQCRFWHRSRVM